MTATSESVIAELREQNSSLEKATRSVHEHELLLSDFKQQLTRTQEALSHREAEITATVLTCPSLSSESKRSNAIRLATRADPDWIELRERAWQLESQVRTETIALKSLTEFRSNLLEHFRGLGRVAELLAAQHHDNAQSKRQVASQQYLAGMERK